MCQQALYAVLHELACRKNLTIDSTRASSSTCVCDCLGDTNTTPLENVTLTIVHDSFRGNHRYRSFSFSLVPRH